mgnify:CR=1 FL=1
MLWLLNSSITNPTWDDIRAYTKKETPEEAEKAYRMYGARPFSIKGKECRDWPEIVVRDTNELRAVEFLIHASLKWARLDD